MLLTKTELADKYGDAYYEYIAWKRAFIQAMNDQHLNAALGALKQLENAVRDMRDIDAQS